MLSGDAGTDVTLEVKKRGGDGTPQKITLTRTATAVVPKKRVVEVEGGGGLFTGASGPANRRRWCTSRRRSRGCASAVDETSSSRRTSGTRTWARAVPPGATFKLEVELPDVAPPPA